MFGRKSRMGHHLNHVVPSAPPLQPFDVRCSIVVRVSHGPAPCRYGPRRIAPGKPRVGDSRERCSSRTAGSTAGSRCSALALRALSMGGRRFSSFSRTGGRRYIVFSLSSAAAPLSIRISLACGGSIPGSSGGNLRITLSPAASTSGRCRREGLSEPAIFTLGAIRTVAPRRENVLESPATWAGLLSTVGSGGGANKCAAEITGLWEDASEPPQRGLVDRTADGVSDVTNGASRLQEVASSRDATSEHAGSRRAPAAIHPHTTLILCGKRSISIVRDKKTPRARHGSIHARLVVSAHRRSAGVPINQTNTNLPLAQCGVFTVVKALVSRTS